MDRWERRRHEQSNGHESRSDVPDYERDRYRGGEREDVDDPRRRSAREREAEHYENIDRHPHRIAYEGGRGSQDYGSRRDSRGYGRRDYYGADTRNEDYEPRSSYFRQRGPSGGGPSRLEHSQGGYGSPGGYDRGGYDRGGGYEERGYEERGYGAGPEEGGGYRETRGGYGYGRDEGGGYGREQQGGYGGSDVGYGREGYGGRGEGGIGSQYGMGNEPRGWYGGQNRSHQYGRGFEPRQGSHRVQGMPRRSTEWFEQSGRDQWQYGQSYPNEGGPESDFRGMGPRGYKRSPQRIREDICERLTDDPYIDASEIELEVSDDGIVELSGCVDSRWTKRYTEDVVDHVRGVRDIRNLMKIREDFWAPTSQRSDTDRVEAKDETKIAKDQGTPNEKGS